MWTRQNKTRLWEWEYTIQKPMANDVVMRNWLFVALVDWYIIPADWTTPIEWCAINDRYSWENNEHRYCIYQPKRDWEHFTMEVDNGTISQEDVGKTFRITSWLQHINYTTKADTGWQFRLEEVLNDTLWIFTYAKEMEFAEQWPQWEDGATPELEIWTVAKLQPNENPTATLEKIPWTNTYVLNLWIPAGATWPKGEQWEDGDKWNPGNPWQPWEDWQNWIDWTDGIDWISPHREWEWNWGRTYTKLAMVRYPDTDNVYWTWIWDWPYEATWPNVPWTDPYWKKMNRDWDTWPQWEDWWTIVVPVEWKPGKDWVWVDGKDWQDWISPHNRWYWSATTQYNPLDLVRADTWDDNVFWDPIYWWYITRNGSYWHNPATSSDREMVVVDWNWLASAKEYIDDFRKNALILVKATWQQVSKVFDNWWVQSPQTVQFTNYYWATSKEVIDYTSTQIIIKKTWFYRVFAHTILQCNPASQTPYINMWRMSVYKNNNIALWTSKQWWPFISTQVTSWLWLDLILDIEVPLFAWDTLWMLVRCQSDADNVDWKTWVYKIIGQDDETWSSGSWTLWWAFATYMWVQMITDWLEWMWWWAI